MGKSRRLKLVRRAVRGTQRETITLDEARDLISHPALDLALAAPENQAPQPLQMRRADEWPAPGLYNVNEFMKRRFPLPPAFARVTRTT